MTKVKTVIWRRVLPATVLVAVAFALGHQLDYLVQYGANAGSALARTGHDGQWTLALLTIVVFGAALVVAAAIELKRLGRQARGIRQSASAGSMLDLARDVVLLFLVVLALSLVVFLVVENLEYAASGLAAPGLTLLVSPEHQHTLVVFELVSLAVALVAGLYRWRRDILVELIELARQLRLHGRAPVGPRCVELTAPATSAVRSTPPGRAPPLLA